MQEVHHEFYNERVPRLIKTISVMAQVYQAKVLGRDRKRQRPMEIDMLRKFLRRADPKAHLFDPFQAEYAEWQEANGDRVLGMRHKKTKQKHGVVRVMRNDGITEATYKFGMRCGLCREVTPQRTWIWFCRDDKILSSFQFDRNFL